MKPNAKPAPDDEALKLLDPDNSFGRRLAEDHDTLARLAASGDPAAVQIIVHKLAGAAGTFGYAEVGEIAITLDDQALAGQKIVPDDLAELLVALKRAINQRTA